MSSEDPEIRKRIDYCKAVASFERYRGHGGFMTSFLEAFLVADSNNTLILLPAMEQLIKKYHLKDEHEALHHTIPGGA